MIRSVLLPLAFAACTLACAQELRIHHFHCPGVVLHEKTLLGDLAGFSEKAKLSLDGDKVKLLFLTEPDPSGYSLFLSRNGLDACRSRYEATMADPGAVPITEGLIGGGSGNEVRHTLIIER